MSYMFQSARLLPWRTVRENIRIVRQDAAEEEVAAIIAAVGCKALPTTTPGSFLAAWPAAVPWPVPFSLAAHLSHG